MKFIVKQSEPDEFSAWKSLANDNWQPYDADLRRFISGYLKTDQQNKLGEFWATINHLFGAIAA